MPFSSRDACQSALATINFVRAPVNILKAAHATFAVSPAKLSHPQRWLENQPARRRDSLEGVVLVSVLGLCLFLCSLAARFCFV
jgi:hypothetical protein